MIVNLLIECLLSRFPSHEDPKSPEALRGREGKSPAHPGTPGTQGWGPEVPAVLLLARGLEALGSLRGREGKGPEPQAPGGPRGALWGP